jgi:hypothetical protein
LERGDVDQLVIETLDRYITALGGHLRVVADFDDHDVTVSTSEIDRTQERTHDRTTAGA